MSFLLVIGLLTIVYSIGFIWVSSKVGQVRRMEFKVLPFVDENNPVPYYAIGFRLKDRQWAQGSELLLGYKFIWNNYQREILAMRFTEEKEALLLMREFKSSLREISSWDIIKRKKKSVNS